jgi:NAD(P)-dependent dehydrogenase (short-subunit alcohol dehydrogenase family)
MKRLKNKIAIITGAAGGMGKAEAILFAREGAKVIATDNQVEKLKKWVSDFKKKEDVEIELMAHDVSSESDWKKVVEKALQLHRRIDVLVNNAGIFPPFLFAEDTDKKIWDKVISVNLAGVFFGCKAVIPHMKKSGGGSIINISSIAGMAGGAGVVYSASKGGVRLITKDLAVEYGKNKIRVNSIMPGSILTPMTEDLMKDEKLLRKSKNMSALGRIGKAEEVAWGAVFLASDESSFVTGADLVIDGGCLAKY